MPRRYASRTWSSFPTSSFGATRRFAATKTFAGLPFPCNGLFQVLGCISCRSTRVMYFVRLGGGVHDPAASAAGSPRRRCRSSALLGRLRRPAPGAAPGDPAPRRLSASSASRTIPSGSPRFFDCSRTGWRARLSTTVHSSTDQRRHRRACLHRLVSGLVSDVDTRLIEIVDPGHPGVARPGAHRASIPVIGSAQRCALFCSCEQGAAIVV